MPSEDLSGSQLEKLGDRLRAGPLTLVDLLQLRRFLETLEPFAEESFAKIRDLDAEAAGLRPAQITRRNVKTIRSIPAKLGVNQRHSGRSKTSLDAEWSCMTS
jgi:hypothetical protein